MPIDALGHPINVGDTVFTHEYGGPSYRLITKVTKVTKKAVYVNVKRFEREYNENKKQYEYVCKDVSVRRRPDQFLVVNEQLKYNQKKYPENLL
jgi:hypothetical protein